MSRTHDSPQDSQDDWQSAAPGEVAQLGRRLQQRRTRRQFLQAGGLASSLVAIGVSTWLYKTRRDSVLPGGLTCEAVAALVPNWKSGTLDEPRTNQLIAHLKACPRCRPLLDQT